MRIHPRVRSGFAWLELLLGLAAIVLLFQLFPSLWFACVWAVDVRNWSRGGWLGLNAVAVLVLCGIRFGPELYKEWRERGARLAINREKQEKQRQLTEQREALERLQRGRARRVI